MQIGLRKYHLKPRRGFRERSEKKLLESILRGRLADDSEEIVPFRGRLAESSKDLRQASFVCDDFETSDPFEAVVYYIAVASKNSTMAHCDIIYMTFFIINVSVHVCDTMQHIHFLVLFQEMAESNAHVNKGKATEVATKTLLYTWGLGKSGQLGTGHEQTEHTPQIVKLPGDRKLHICLKQVACGGLYTGVLTDRGDIYTFGSGKYGRLGSGCEDTLPSPVKISVPDKVLQISCGSWHGAAVTCAGSLVVWGHRKGCGQSSADSTVAILTPPSVLRLTQEHRVVGVACGHNYTIAWTDAGRVMSWGSGHHGLLGHGSTNDISSPRVISALQEVDVVQAAAGYSHSAFVTSQGGVHVCGKGKDGALGIGETNLSDASSPVQVAFPESVHITKISCSVGEHHGHTLALTNDGRVFSWGGGYKGKLGLGHQDSRYTPTLIPPAHFNMESVTVVCAGGIHSTAATAAGSVFTWGCGSDGRLGHPEGQGHRYLFRSDIPKRVVGLGEKVKRALVACSYYHTAAIVEL
ncbi:hypothetical protein BaRGS_00020364 [Batillaria attramentaria]|uniref:RCC1-like domain-containing protein n=1 Tax=Batillaria attramentaria TaxID=370345 RepID=A0ABD0KMZ2_9CAEN